MRRATLPTMKRTSVSVAIFLLFAAGSTMAAKPKKGGGGGHVSQQTARAIDELQGKFKWGMAIDESKKLIADEIHKKYAEDWKKAVGDPAAQDAINAKIRDEITRIDKSYIEFKGNKTPWEVSIIDREFAHNNSETRLVIAE